MRINDLGPEDIAWLPVSLCPSKYRDELPTKKLGKRAFKAMDPGTLQKICHEQGFNPSDVRLDPHPQHARRWLVSCRQRWLNGRAYLGLQKLSLTGHKRPPRGANLRERRTKVNRLTDRARILSEKRHQMVREAANPKKVADSQFDSLLDHPDIKSITVRRGLIEVRTHCITCSYSGHTYKFGEYRVKIPTSVVEMRSSDRYGIRIWAVGHNPHHEQHPHVNSKGQPCFGNVKGQLGRTLKRKDFTQAILIIVQFLKSYCSSYPYLDIGAWPKVKTEKKPRARRASAPSEPKASVGAPSGNRRNGRSRQGR